MNDQYNLVRAIVTGLWFGMLTSVFGLPNPWNIVAIIFCLAGIIFTWVYKRNFDSRPLYERRLRK